MRILYLVGLLFISSQVAYAHPFEVCLHRLSQSATALKTCQLAQAHEGQCEQQQSILEQRKQRCMKEEFTAPAITRAMDFGFAQLQGDIARSPFARQVQKERWETSLMKANVERFKKNFPLYEKHVGAVMDHFNTSQCPSMYQGYSDRWLFVRSMNLTRYPLDQENGFKQKGYTVYMMAPQKGGQCYNPDSSKSGSGQSYTVANIPELMLQHMEQSGSSRLLRCQHDYCLEDVSALEVLYKQYQKQYREYRQLILCADIDMKNSKRRAVKGKKRSKQAMPDYCPAEEVQVKSLNARGALDQLIQRLFQDVNIRVQTAKIEQK